MMYDFCRRKDPIRAQHCTLVMANLLQKATESAQARLSHTNREQARKERRIFSSEKKYGGNQRFNTAAIN